jgi:two-component system, sensor histidine kinase and response regulator
VELMGGRIWLDSETGRGSTFHFLARFGVGRSTAGLEFARQADLSGIPVLVVDDNATNRRILGEMLRQWQMAPAVAESARIALDELETAATAGKPFRLVLTDASMPDMDGLELVKQIRQRPHLGRVKIIVLTSAGRWCDTGCCLGLGLETCLSKPVGQSELRNAIVSAVGAAGTTAGRGGAGRCPVKHQTRSLRILLAEDNLVNQKLARRLLEKHGHGVAVVGNGREALAAIEKDEFDLVLMDVQMPEMDGFVATQTIRESEAGTGRHLPIIAMTAHAMKGDQERCLEAGMDGYISKPINAAELLAVIDETANLSFC